MKDNINIEELFKKNLENMEGKVNPDSWAKISQGIGAGTTATVTGGMSALVKTILISGGIVAAGLTAVYVSVEDENETIEIAESNESLPDNETVITLQDSVIRVQDVNDPIIEEFKEEIERELGNIQYNEVIDQDLIDQIIIPDEVEDDIFENNEIIEDEVVVSIEDDNTDDVVEVLAVPSGKMTYSPVNNTAPSMLSFESNAKNHTSVKWDFGDGSTGKGLNIKHEYTQPGEYIVSMKVYGENSVYEESKTIEIKTESSVDNIPNVITPDDDRINDLFSVKTSGIETFFISIRDTQGNVVFESNDKNFEWDGTNLFDEKVPSGTYVYSIIAEGEDGSVFKIPGQLYVRY